MTVTAEYFKHPTRSASNRLSEALRKVRRQKVSYREFVIRTNILVCAFFINPAQASGVFNLVGNQV